MAKDDEAPAEGGDEDEERAPAKREIRRNKVLEEGALEEKSQSKRRERASYDDAEEEEVEMIKELKKGKKAAAKKEREAERVHRTEEMELAEEATKKEEGDDVGPIPKQEAAPKQFRNKKLLGSDEILRDYDFDVKKLQIIVAIQVLVDACVCIVSGLIIPFFPPQKHSDKSRREEDPHDKST